MIAITPVILCGGSGTRLWPLSRTGFPKQFLCLTGNESLFQLAAKRLTCLSQEGFEVAAPFTVSGEKHRFLASEQLRESGFTLGAALLEPVQAGIHPLQATAFVEKPNLATAEAYIQQGGYFCSVVMFVLKASMCLKALQLFRPNIDQATQAPQS